MMHRYNTSWGERGVAGLRTHTHTHVEVRVAFLCSNVLSYCFLFLVSLFFHFSIPF